MLSYLQPASARIEPQIDELVKTAGAVAVTNHKQSMALGGWHNGLDMTTVILRVRLTEVETIARNIGSTLSVRLSTTIKKLLGIGGVAPLPAILRWHFGTRDGRDESHQHGDGDEKGTGMSPADHKGAR